MNYKDLKFLIFAGLFTVGIVSVYMWPDKYTRKKKCMACHKNIGFDDWKCEHCNTYVNNLDQIDGFDIDMIRN